jgi:hypothetical protein
MIERIRPTIEKRLGGRVAGRRTENGEKGKGDEIESRDENLLAER